MTNKDTDDDKAAKKTTLRVPPKLKEALTIRADQYGWTLNQLCNALFAIHLATTLSRNPKEQQRILKDFMPDDFTAILKYMKENPSEYRIEPVDMPDSLFGFGTNFEQFSNTAKLHMF